ncbi:hypothetical protein D3C81_1062030 [compost metagenome]
MGFKEVHSRWLTNHLKRRTGERKSRLERGHAHGEQLFLEKIWWPLFGHFESLHPEYEILDWRGRPYFVDFVWKSGQVSYAFEVKGYGPHVQNTDRIRYRQELNRETFLQIAGYRVVSIPYDDLEQCPELTISLLRSLLAPYSALKMHGGHEYSRLELDILRKAIHSDGAIRPIDLVNELKINHRTVRKYMAILCEKGKFRSVASGKSRRVCRYDYIHSVNDAQLW